jgi:ATP-dependent RNA helicase DDX19/DBP5
MLDWVLNIMATFPGAAFNLLVNEQDERNLRKIERHFNKMIPDVAWDDDNGIEQVLKDAGLA